MSACPYDLVILDRDGVINVDPGYVHQLADWQAIPGSLEAIAALHQAGCRVGVATNQSGVGRGYFTLEDLERFHQHMRQAVAVHGGYLDAIVYCPHHPEDGCDCRKPQPTMLQTLMSEFQATSVAMVGDSLRDMQAALAAGCDGFLVRSGDGLSTLQAHGEWFEAHSQVRVVDDLAALVRGWLFRVV